MVENGDSEPALPSAGSGPAEDHVEGALPHRRRTVRIGLTNGFGFEQARAARAKTSLGTLGRSSHRRPSHFEPIVRPVLLGVAVGIVIFLALRLRSMM